MSECVNEHLKRKGQKYSPEGTQVESDDLDDNADVSTTSGSVKDVRKRPKKLSNTSECERKHSKQRSRQNSPSRPGEEPEEPDNKAVVPGDPQNDPEHPRSISDERVDRTNTPCRRNSPDGHLGELKVLRDVESDWDRRSDGEGDWISGRRCQKDGAMSGAYRDLKQVERRPLATEEARQQRQYGRCVKNVPRSSMAPSKHPRHPIKLPNPPRR